MKSSIQNRIHELFIQSSTFAKNDVLVNIHPGKDILKFTGEAIQTFENFSSIIKLANQTFKESGTNPLCKTKGILIWEIDDVEVHSPLVITPVHYSIDKVRNQVELNWDDDASFLNPFVVNRLSTFYDKHDQLPLEPEPLIEQLSKYGFNSFDPEASFIGIIHHHRHQLLKELELLHTNREFSSPLLALLGEEVEEEIRPIAENLLLPADVDHRSCFQLFEHSNLCIEGPPGTGKSQILTNFIGKALIDQHSLLVVSEKKSALDVLNKKLASFNLDILAMIGTDNMDNKSLIWSIRDSWNYFENYRPQTIGISTRTEREDNLQLTLDIINQPSLIGGIDYITFTQFTKDLEFDEFEYTLDVPLLTSFISNEAILVKLYKHQLQNSLGILHANFLAEKQLKQLIGKIETLIAFAKAMSLKGYQTLEDVHTVKRQLSVIQLFENELVKRYATVYQPNTKTQKQFNRLYKKWLKLSSKVQQFESTQTSWKIIPSFEEFEDLTTDLNAGFFTKLKAKKRWNEISTIAYSPSSKSIIELQRFLADTKELHKITSEFEELGIDETLIPAIASSLGLFTEEKWNYYEQIPAELKVNGLELLKQIEAYQTELSIYFNLDQFSSIESQLNDLKKAIHYFIEWENELCSIDSATLKLLRKHEDFLSLKKQVTGSHYSNFKQAYPRLASFSMHDLSTKIDACIAATTEEGVITSQQILNQTFSQFQVYGELLSTPARQLSEEQKQLKQRLKKGKSILTKEFNKSRQHLSIRELYQSEAKEWIQLLKPIWMSNPYLVASLFPLEKGLFEQCIFDEASQLILQGGLGSIQRANRVVVAGDTQQMEPTSYFKAGNSEQISLLQHAHYYYKTNTLTHHYRSVHPSLIEFSNRHFYNNKLLVYPSPVEDRGPIHFHYVNSGVFDERQNQEEAKVVAKLIQQKLSSKDTIGIVAFSQTQLDCIWDVLDIKSKEILEHRIENNSAFFKPLEKVQGDECHTLIISFGYGKTENGDFPMRFGPMNTESGRKRLNVLVSRASHQIDFVASVKAEDFKLSDNESIELLRKWFMFIDQNMDNNSMKFPLGLLPEIDKNKLTIPSIHSKTTNAIELITLHFVLVQRGWKLQYE